MMNRARKPTRPGDIFLLAILLANPLCGVGLIGALRGDLAKDLVVSESAFVSSKISAYLWGKILRFSSVAEQLESRGVDRLPVRGDPDALTVVRALIADGKFQRIRSETGELLPINIGTPKELPNRGYILPLGFLLTDVPGPARRYIIATISLADVDGYLGDLRRRGILCRVVDPEGQTLLGPTGGFPPRGDPEFWSREALQ